MNQAPVQITARGFELLDWWRERIGRKMRKLEERHGALSHCRVLIEVPHKHQHKGRLFKVRLDLDLPRGLVVATREAPSLGQALEEAFGAAEKSLEYRARGSWLSLRQHAPRRPHGVWAEAII